MSVGQTRKTAGTSYPEVPFISACGSRCGSGQKADGATPNSRKESVEALFAISIPNMQTSKTSCDVPALTTHTRRRKWPRNNLAIYNKNLTFIMQGFVNGGGEWIRTTEVVDNRFTVCPLWPLGNSPINYAVLYKACPAFLSGRTAQFGAGERTRTPDLLITNSVGSVH